jgi:TPR repeat protein
MMREKIKERLPACLFWGSVLLIITVLWNYSYLMCQFGYGESCGEFATNNLYSENAIVFYKKGCDLSDAKSCNGLAEVYYEGLGTEKNLQKALTFYEKACGIYNYRNEYNRACETVGTMYRLGKGTKIDYNQAFLFYKKACDVDNIFGCNGLGILYDSGQGVEKNDKKAREYFQKAVDNIFTETTGAIRSNLAFYYEFGVGGEQNLNYAAKLYQDDCFFESVGCFEAANYYFEGKVVLRDYKFAKKAYETACTKDGNERACEKASMSYWNALLDDNPNNDQEAIVNGAFQKNLERISNP